MIDVIAVLLFFALCVLVITGAMFAIAHGVIRLRGGKR